MIIILHEYYITDAQMREYKRYTTYEWYKRELTYKYTRKGTSMSRERALTSLLRGNSRGIQGVWKDVALDGRLETTLPLRHSDQQQGGSTGSKLQNLDMRIQGSQ